jgi:hypothetical protein
MVSDRCASDDVVRVAGAVAGDPGRTRRAFQNLSSEIVLGPKKSFGWPCDRSAIHPVRTGSRAGTIGEPWRHRAATRGPFANPGRRTRPDAISRPNDGASPELERIIRMCGLRAAAVDDDQLLRTRAAPLDPDHRDPVGKETAPAAAQAFQACNTGARGSPEEPVKKSSRARLAGRPFRAGGAPCRGPGLRRSNPGHSVELHL